MQRSVVPKHFYYLDKHISKINSLTKWQPNDWLENAWWKFMITTIKFPNHAAKAAKNTQTKTHLQSSLTAR